MANIREILNKINSISSTQQITKAMKMVAASKLNKIQAKAQGLQPYLSAINDLVLKLLERDINLNCFSHFQNRDIKNALFIIIASDRGLCGSFNTNILKFSHLAIDKFKKENALANVSIMPIGLKVKSYFKKLDYVMFDKYISMQAKFSFEDVSEIADFLVHEFNSSKIDRIFLCYTHFKSTSSSQPTLESYLPIDVNTLSKVVRTEEKIKNSSVKWIFETPVEEIISTLLPIYMRIKLYSSFIQSNASEHSSRMISMNKASDNAVAMQKSLKVDYNRRRQASITQEISEIVSGAESLVN